MSKSFSYAGVSRLNGKMKVRWANDIFRIKVLAKNGHSDIDIIELKWPMNKEDALEYLLSIDFANGNTEVQEALDSEAKKRRVVVKPTMAMFEKKAAEVITATEMAEA